MLLKRHLVTLVVFILPFSALAQKSNKTALTAKINKLATTLHAKVGVAVLGLDFQDSLFINGDKHYPMQSVFKLPLAMTILHKADKNQLPLNMNMRIPRERLDKDTWSPILKDYPAGDIDITITDLLRYTVSKSDNNTCDILFGLAGGPAVVNSFIDSLGVKGINIAATEAEMKQGWNVQYTNWSQPVAMAHLLNILYKGTALNKEHNDLLMKFMLESENSPARIKGQLPTGTQVAHKTGTSNTDAHGITAATNDVGIITLPNGKHIALVVFVSDYKGEPTKGEKTIADISKAVWDYYTAK